MEAARGLIILLHHAPLRLLDGEEAARDAVTEGSRGNPRDQPLGDLIDARCQQTKRLPREQNRQARNRRACGKPKEYPQGGPGFGRAGLVWTCREPGKPPPRHCDGASDRSNHDQRRHHGACPVEPLVGPGLQ